jgi:hypothetical protein
VARICPAGQRNTFPDPLAIPNPRVTRTNTILPVRIGGMTVLLSSLGVAFVAFCIWLGVRIVNRRERWAKRTAVGIVVALPVLYVASFGPACWLIADYGTRAEALPSLYLPTGWAIMRSETIADAAHAYALFGMRPKTVVMIPIEDGAYLPIARFF